MSIWVVCINIDDTFLFSTAEKAYSYLLDKLSDLECSAEDGELKEWYRKQANILTQKYEEDKTDFGCEFGWAEEREVD